MNSNAVNTDTVREVHDYLTDADGNITAEVKPVAKTVTRRDTTFGCRHTALADKQAEALARSVANAGHGDEANYLRNSWFPRKSNEFITRAYAAAKANGSHVILDMIEFEKQQVLKYGSWDALPSKIRRAIS